MRLYEKKMRTQCWRKKLNYVAVDSEPWHRRTPVPFYVLNAFFLHFRDISIRSPLKKVSIGSCRARLREKQLIIYQCAKKLFPRKSPYTIFCNPSNEHLMQHIIWHNTKTHISSFRHHAMNANIYKERLELMQTQPLFDWDETLTAENATGTRWNMHLVKLSTYMKNEMYYTSCSTDHKKSTSQQRTEKGTDCSSLCTAYRLGRLDKCSSERTKDMRTKVNIRIYTSRFTQVYGRTKYKKALDLNTFGRSWQ